MKNLFLTLLLIMSLIAFPVLAGAQSSSDPANAPKPITVSAPDDDFVPALSEEESQPSEPEINRSATEPLSSTK